MQQTDYFDDFRDTQVGKIISNVCIENYIMSETKVSENVVG